MGSPTIQLFCIRYTTSFYNYSTNAYPPIHVSLSFLSFLLLFAVDQRFLFLSTATMSTTYETSELTSPKTSMAPTTTFAKSKKGVVVLVALCMLFFYTGRLSSSTSGGGVSFDDDAFDASLLRGKWLNSGFQQDVVVPREVMGDDPCAGAACPDRCTRIVASCKNQYLACIGDETGQCAPVLAQISSDCGCGTQVSCATKIVDASGHSGNSAIKAGIKCVKSVWNK